MSSLPCNYNIDLNNSDESSERIKKDFFDILFNTVYKQFGIRKDIYDNFINNVKCKYRDNPYHNFNHAIDATITLYYFFDNLNCDNFTFSQLDKLILITGILCHDVGHFGLAGNYVTLLCEANNVTNENTSCDFVRIFNTHKFFTTSYLEEFHWMLCKEILDSTQLLNVFSNEELCNIEEQIKNIILSTDPLTLKQVIDQSDLYQDKNKIFKLLIKSSDIGGCVKNFDIHLKWSMSLQEEFWNQGDQMKNHLENIPLLFDRTYTNFDQNQVNFFKYYALPLYDKFSKIINNDMLINLQSNYNVWTSSTVV